MHAPKRRQRHRAKSCWQQPMPRWSRSAAAPRKRWRWNALREMKSEIATLVIDAAAKAVGDRNTEQQDKLLYDKFIAEAGEAHGGKIQ